MIGLTFPTGWYYNSRKSRFELWEAGRMYAWVVLESVIRGGDALWVAIARHRFGGIRYPVFNLMGA